MVLDVEALTPRPLPFRGRGDFYALVEKSLSGVGLIRASRVSYLFVFEQNSPHEMTS